MKDTFIPYINGTLAEEPLLSSNSGNIDIEDAKQILESFSSVSKFEDNQWLINKTNEDQNLTDKQRRVNFLNITNINNLTTMKLSALIRLMKRQSTRAVAYSVLVVREFLTTLTVQDKDFVDISSEDILYYYNYLFEGEQSTSIKGRLSKWFIVKDFFKTMNYHSQYRIMDKYITEQFPDKRRINEKLIPDDVAEKLDIEFLKDDVPSAFKVIYWLLRLLPNRITEVLSMKMNCVKRINNDYYIVSIPTFKQTGPYRYGNIKLIEIKYNGIGKYLIDLINNYINERKEHENSKDDDFLFYSYRYALIKDNNNSYYYKKWQPYTLLTIDRINYFLKNFCKHKNITMENGEPFSVTSHQFRHNSTSDRINSGIFRSIDIQGLTYHHSTTMIEQTYTHQNKNSMINDSPVVFRGRIINTENENKMSKLLNKPYAKSIYKLGICSDIRSCNKDKSKCIRCEFMVPDFDDMDYYEHELNDWIRKKESALQIGNIIFAELCDEWIDAYQIIINKVLRALTNENVSKKGDTDENTEQ